MTRYPHRRNAANCSRRVEANFGLSCTIVDRGYLAALRRDRGYGANPWTAGSYFVISHSLLTDDT